MGPEEQMGPVKRIWYLSPMRAAKVQASLRIRAVSPEPSLLTHTSSESRGTFKQKNRSLAPLNGWACAVEICHDGMLEDTNSLDGAQIKVPWTNTVGAKILYSNSYIVNQCSFLWRKHALKQVLWAMSPENLSSEVLDHARLNTSLLSYRS